MASVAGLLRHVGATARSAALPPAVRDRQQFAEVTNAVTAATSNFAFMQAYRGGDVIARAQYADRAGWRDGDTHAV